MECLILGLSSTMTQSITGDDLTYSFAVRAPDLTYVFIASSICLSIISLRQNKANCFLTGSANLKDKYFVRKEGEKSYVNTIPVHSQTNILFEHLNMNI
jgi:hypothetical protein